MRFHLLAKKLYQRDRGITVAYSQHFRITGLTDDSRKVMPGNIFAALPGTKQDGTGFIGAALKRGAAALLVRRPVKGLRLVPQIVSDDPRRTLGHLAAMLRGDPSRQMKVIGITGTNGKTTTAFLLREILEGCGMACGLMGTVWNIVGDERRAARLTTPSALEVQNLLAEMRAHGQEACAMEVSSHALDQQRIAGVRLAGAIFTNLSQDHLDYHGNLESYFEAKAKLFDHLDPAEGIGLVNSDGDWAARMRKRAPGICLSFGNRAGADIRIGRLEMALHGMTFDLCRGPARMVFRTPMTGRYNASNLAAAIGMALSMGLPVERIQQAVRGFKGAPGRLERVEFSGKGPAVFVDYAHTPDALENVLSTLREVCSHSRLTCVVGCGGDRDRTKRPRMGAIAAELADRPILTSDNPRSENPAAIIEEMLAGVSPQKRPIETEVDRRRAIQLAIAEAGPGDVVLIAGKGHEDYQIFSDRTVHFDDREEARRALKLFWGMRDSERRGAAAV